MVPIDPTFEEMRQIVCVKNQRPPLIEERLKNDSTSILLNLAKVLTECWTKHPDARLTSLRVKKRLGRLQSLIINSKPAEV